MGPNGWNHFKDAIINHSNLTSITLEGRKLVEIPLLCNYLLGNDIGDESLNQIVMGLGAKSPVTGLYLQGIDSKFFIFR